MARLPPVDLNAIYIKDLLHKGKREEALARLDKVMQSGKAGEDTRALAEYLATAGKGHPPFGAKHLWYEIGLNSDEMRRSGLPTPDRLANLRAIYMISSRQLDGALAKYNRAIREIQEIDEEFYEP